MSSFGSKALGLAEEHAQLRRDRDGKRWRDILEGGGEGVNRTRSKKCRKWERYRETCRNKINEGHNGVDRSGLGGLVGYSQWSHIVSRGFTEKK